MSYSSSNVYPPSHPRGSNSLRLIHQPHIKQQLCSPPDRRLQSGENPSVRITGVLSDEHRFELSLKVRGYVKFLLTDQRSSPSASLMLINLPALSIEAAGPLLGSDLTVNFNHGALDERDVVFGAEGGDRAGWGSRSVGAKNDTRPGGIDLVGWVANTSDPWDIR